MVIDFLYRAPYQIFLIILSFAMGSTLLAEPRAARGTSSTLPPTLVQSSADSGWLQKPKGYRESDQVYLEYFATLDRRIYWDYVDKWQYQEKLIPYALTTWNHEYLEIGTQDYFGKARFDYDVRKEFAEQVLRIRLDNALRKYFENPTRAPGLQRMSQAYERIKAANFKLYDDSKRGEVKLAYDVTTDRFKFEYTKGLVELSCFHPHFIGALTGSKPKWELITARLKTNLHGTSPQVSVSYQFANELFEASITKPIRPNLSGEILSIHPFREILEIIPSYTLRFTYLF